MKKHQIRTRDKDSRLERVEMDKYPGLATLTTAPAATPAAATAGGGGGGEVVSPSAAAAGDENGWVLREAEKGE